MHIFVQRKTLFLIRRTWQVSHLCKTDASYLYFLEKMMNYIPDINPFQKLPDEDWNRLFRYLKVISIGVIILLLIMPTLRCMIKLLSHLWLS